MGVSTEQHVILHMAPWPLRMGSQHFPSLFPKDKGNVQP